MNRTRIILGKEIRELLRNKRTLFIVFVLPVLLYPLMIIGFSQLMITQMNKIEQKTFVMALEGDAPGLNDRFEADSQLVVIPYHSTSDSSLMQGDLEAIVKIPDHFITILDSTAIADIDIFYDGSSEKSQAAQDRIEDIVYDYRDSIVSSRLDSMELAEGFIRPVNPNTVNKASAKKMGGFVFGRMLAFILVAMVITGAYNGAVDMFAGERERGTMETLLVSPADRIEIVLGKYLTVLIITVLVAILNLSVMALTLSMGLGAMNIGGQFPIEFSISLQNVLVFFATLLPMAALFSAVFLLISAFARNYKEAQSFLTPVFLIAYFPAMITMLPGFEPSIASSFIPVLNVALLFKKMLVSSIPVTEVLITIFSTTAYAIAAIWFTTRLLLREDILLSDEKMSFFNFIFSKKSNIKLKKDEISFGHALLLFSITLILMFFIGSKMQSKDMLTGLIYTELFLVLAPVLLFKRIMKFDFSKAFRVFTPSFAQIIITILTAVAGFIFIQQLSIYLGYFIDVPIEYARAMERLFEDLATVGPVLGLLVLALLPAVCEEIMFRGFILRGATRTFGITAGVIITGVLFGLFHLDPYRLFGTVMLGIFIGAITIRGGIFIAMLAHFVNNTSAYLWASNNRVQQIIPPGPNGEFPLWIFISAIVFFAAGLYALLKLKPIKGEIDS
ncbi:MAG: ABC transporter permease subunit/CPBP intramembrane protease [Candidatus Zixiibacteriota bacterium]